MMNHFRESILSLITETSANLPSDVRIAIQTAIEAEAEGSRAGLSMSAIALNIDMAVDRVAPVCQDTGMPTFFIHSPRGADQLQMQQEIMEAVVEATRTGKLRPNAVDSISGKNSGNNLGSHVPVIHFEPWDRDEIEVRLILKGGGCENKNIQYSLPAEIQGLGRAARDMDGVRKCLLHAVWQAQGQGCSPGFIGVGVGGDRTSGYELAKKQLFRRVDDTNPTGNCRDLRRIFLLLLIHLALDRWDSGERQRFSDAKSARRTACQQAFCFCGLQLLGISPSWHSGGPGHWRHQRLAVSRQR